MRGGTCKGLFFHARDLHLVLGPSVDGKPARFKVTIDGQAPEGNHEVDTDAEGNGVVRGDRLYQLIRQSGPAKDHTFAIKFEDPTFRRFRLRSAKAIQEIKMILEKDDSRNKTSRRVFLLAGGAAAAAFILNLRRRAEVVEAKSALPKDVQIVAFSKSGQREEVVTVPTIVKADDEWKRQLSPEAYEITRQAGTERPYSGEYWNLHERGIYRCICCDTPLFSSDTKFESGTGWPSFWQPIAKENVRESADLSLGIERTEVLCRRCNAHLGHVFDDGPRPTGLRYCMNSVALSFAKLS